MLQIFQMLLWGFATLVFVASIVVLVKSIRLLNRVEQTRKLQCKGSLKNKLESLVSFKQLNKLKGGE